MSNLLALRLLAVSVSLLCSGRATYTCTSRVCVMLSIVSALLSGFDSVLTDLFDHIVVIVLDQSFRDQSVSQSTQSTSKVSSFTSVVMFRHNQIVSVFLSGSECRMNGCQYRHHTQLEHHRR